MSTDNRILDLAWEAAEDLSSDQYRIVVLDTGKVRRPNAATDVPLGVLQNSPVAGEAAAVRLMGVSKVELGGTIAENAWVVLEYNDATDAGKGITAPAASTSLAIGRCLAGGDEDELGEVLLSGAVQQVTLA